MPKSRNEETASFPRVSVARTQLNHVVGYSGILRQDALDLGRKDLAALFETIAESAISLGDPLDVFLEESQPPSAEKKNLEQKVYSIIYSLIALIQDAKGKVRDSGLRELIEETDRLLLATNSTLELLSTQGAESGDYTAPASPADSPERETEEDEAISKPGRILVVDDNPINRELLARHLERQGHLVRVASDGLSALELLRTESFDVAIIDVMLPGMNGYQLLERIKAEEPLKGVHAIVISALEDTSAIARCIQLGAEDYLPREFEPIILRARIESCLEKKRMKEEQELYVAALVEAQEKLSAELRGGAAYVRSLLPGRISFPELSIDWIFEPSASLGGDVFGYHLLGSEPGKMGSGKLALYLIDVSGHGIEAALFSVTLMNMLKTQVLPGADFADPASVLSRLNVSFQMEEQNNLFFTAWYGVWDHSSRTLTYASAGSPPGLLVFPDGSFEELSTCGSIVGMDVDSSYDSARASVPRGSGLYVFSDGIYEFRGHDGSIFGFDRFRNALVDIASAKGNRNILQKVVDMAKTEADSERFSDDVSLLELRLD